MRLDHLLSKELLAASAVQAPGQSGCLCGELMGGTCDRVLIVSFGSQYAASVVGTGSGGGVGACTLLGPEGPGAGFRVGVVVPFAGLAGWSRGGWVVGCCSYFENYTVDASIFEMAFGLSLIDDLLDHEKTHVISSL